MGFTTRFTWGQWVILALIVLLLVGTAGLAAGYLSGTQSKAASLAVARAVEIQTQFELGQANFEAGEYALARQRFEYVLNIQPDYPGAVEMLSQTLLKLSDEGLDPAEIIKPTATIPPTPDTRAIDELFAQAEAQLAAMDWGTLVHTIQAIRDIDPQYLVFEVDRMLYLSHRYNGISKIMDLGDLEGGLYDLALAEKFAPMDRQAGIYRDWARLYQIGVSFWGVYPDRAVEYFSQLAAAAPYLRDLSGIFARDRYRMALVQYGDALVSAGEWCLAFDQYTLAQGLYDDPDVRQTLVEVGEQCQLTVATPTPTETPLLTATLGTPTTTITTTLEATFTPTPTLEISPTATETVVSEPTLTPTPTDTQVPPGKPTEEPSPTPTPTETATETGAGGG